MEYLQALLLPIIIILPASIIYAFLIRFIGTDRRVLAIVSGLFGGFVYGEFFGSSMHLYNSLITISYFGMIGAFMFYGLAELKNKKRLISLNRGNIGFFVASLIIFYLVFFDIRGIVFGLNLEFISDYWVVWLGNLAFIISIGFVSTRILRRHP